MRMSRFLVASAALIPLVISGCGSEDADATQTFMHHDKYAVEVGTGSNTVTSLPFYLDGVITLTGMDADINTDVTSGQKDLKLADNTGTTADAAKDIATKSAGKAKAIMFSTATAITLTGSMTKLAGVDAYVLKIVQGTVSHEIGVVRALNGTVYTFNAEEVKAGAKPVLRTLASNKLDVSSRTLNADNTFKTGEGDRFLDYSVNVPTTVDNQMAPYTGVTGCAKLVLGGTTNTFRLVKDEGETKGNVAVTATDGVFTAVDEIKFDWLQSTTTTKDISVKNGSTVTIATGATVTRFVKGGSTVPGMYWKAGMGFVECLGRVNDDKVYGAEGFTSADGELREATATAPKVQVTFTEYNTNQDHTKFCGFYVADYVVPHAAN